jgi:phosphatidylserine synthase
LPTPAAAGILASFALSYELFESGQEVTVKTIPLIMEKMPFMFKCIPAVILVISLLMVSSVPYAAMKNMKMNKPKSFQLFTLLVIGIILIISYPQNTIFIIFLLYLLSGLTGYVWRYIRLRQSLSLSARLKQSCDNAPGHEDDKQQ